MHTLVVTFNLDGMAEADYYRGCDEGAPAFAEIPGLISKTWLADPSTNTYGGVYRFRDETSLDDYLRSDLFRSIGETPGLARVKAQRFGVLEGPTRVTHGWAVQPSDEGLRPGAADVAIR